MAYPQYCRRFAGACGLIAFGAIAGVLAASFFVPDEQATAGQARGSTGAERRLRELGIKLPPEPKPVATYVPAVRVGNTLYVSGHGPRKPDGSAWAGKVGRDIDLEEGRAAAHAVGLAVLSTVRNTLGSLDRVVRLAKVTGMVNATEDFKQQSQVVNGFSDLMVQVFGKEAGTGARSAVGMASLPGGIPIEVEAIFEVRD